MGTSLSTKILFCLSIYFYNNACPDSIQAKQNYIAEFCCTALKLRWAMNVILNPPVNLDETAFLDSKNIYWYGHGLLVSLQKQSPRHI